MLRLAHRRGRNGRSAAAARPPGPLAWRTSAAHLTRPRAARLPASDGNRRCDRLVSGRRRMKRLPLPGVLSTRTVPPCASAMPFTIARAEAETARTERVAARAVQQQVAAGRRRTARRPRARCAGGDADAAVVDGDLARTSPSRRPRTTRTQPPSGVKRTALVSRRGERLAEPVRIGRRRRATSRRARAQCRARARRAAAPHVRDRCRQQRARARPLRCAAESAARRRARRRASARRRAPATRRRARRHRSTPAPPPAAPASRSSAIALSRMCSGVPSSCAVSASKRAFCSASRCARAQAARSSSSSRSPLGRGGEAFQPAPHHLAQLARLPRLAEEVDRRDRG